MLEKIIMDVCNQMAELIGKNEIDKLKNILFVSFHNKKIVEDKNEVIELSDNSDFKKIELFVAAKTVSGRKKDTLKQYVAELMNFRNAINKNFEDITTMDIRWYLGRAKEHRGNKMTTVRNKVRYLNSFYSFLLNEGLVSLNPVARIEPIKVEQIYEKPFSIEEMESLRKACKNVRDRALVEFLHSTGIRISELCSLKISDIDLHRKEFIVMGKGSKERIVYISDMALYHLNEYLNWRGKEEEKTLEEMKNEALFVSNRNPHGKILKGSIRSLFTKMGKRAGVDNVHPHRFRRTFATERLSRGMKLEELAKLMGHTKIETTLIYCDVVQENIRNAYYRCA